MFMNVYVEIRMLCVVQKRSKKASKPKDEWTDGRMDG